MKVVILAGGFGTRLSEETEITPKPMVQIGGKPIIWHIMKHYSHYGHNEFIILLGYKGYSFKEYFSNYYLHQSDVTIDTANGSMELHNNKSENWKITLVETGLHTMTGGRIKRAQKYIGNQPFMLTYGDGVSDVNLNQLENFHKQHGQIVTMTTIQPDGRFGSVQNDQENMVTSFLEKPKGDGAWINGGFFICNSQIFNYLENDETIFERQPLEKLAESKKLYAFKHKGFWKCMDTLRDKQQLCDYWNKGKAAWKVWK